MQQIIEESGESYAWSTTTTRSSSQLTMFLKNFKNQFKN
jgi:hypothetical protein